MDYCRTCGMRSENSCSLHKILVNPDEDFCSWHRVEPDYCKYCNSIVAKGGLFTSTGLVCGRCVKAIGTCQTCYYSKAPCAFEAYEGPEPKTRQVTKQQGNAILSTVVRNPDIVAKTCTMCKCYFEGECMRDLHCCSFYAEY